MTSADIKPEASPAQQVDATIRFFSDWTTTDLAGYAKAPPDFEEMHRIAHRDCLAGETKTERDAFRKFVGTQVCKPTITLAPGTKHPNFVDLLGLINTAINKYNTLGVAMFNPLDPDTPPSCKQYIECDDGSVKIEYNWGLTFAGDKQVPQWPIPTGSYRVDVRYSVKSEAEEEEKEKTYPEADAKAGGEM